MGKDGTRMNGGLPKSGHFAEEPVIDPGEEQAFVRSNTGQPRAHRQQRPAQKQQPTRSQSPLPRFLRVSSEVKARGGPSGVRGRAGGAYADDARGYEGEEEEEARRGLPRALTFQPRRGRKAPSPQNALGDEPGAQLPSAPSGERRRELPLSPPTPRGAPRVVAGLSPVGPATPPPRAYQRSISSNAAAGEPRWRAWGSRRHFVHLPLGEPGEGEEGAEQDHRGHAGGGAPESDLQGGAPGSSPLRRGVPQTRHGAPAVSPVRSLPRVRLPRVQVQEEGEEGERHGTPFRRMRSQGPRTGGNRQRSPQDASGHTRASPQSPRAGSVAPKSPRFLQALALLSPRLQRPGSAELNPEGGGGRAGGSDVRHGTWSRSRSSSGRSKQRSRGEAEGRDSRGDAEERSRPARRADSTRARKGEGGRRSTSGKPPLTNALPSREQTASPGEAAAVPCAPEEERRTGHDPRTSAGQPVLGSEWAQEAQTLDGRTGKPQSFSPLLRLESQHTGEEWSPISRLEGQHTGDQGEEPLMIRSKSLVQSHGRGQPVVEEAELNAAAAEGPLGFGSSEEAEAASGDPSTPSAVQGGPASPCAVPATHRPLGTEECELQHDSEQGEAQHARLREGPEGSHSVQEAAEDGDGSDEHHARDARDGEAGARRNGAGLEESGGGGKGPVKKRRPRELGKGSLRGERGRGSLRRDFGGELPSARSKGGGTEDVQGGAGGAGKGHARREAMPLFERSSSRGPVRRAEEEFSRIAASPSHGPESAQGGGIAATRSSSQRVSSRAPHSGPAPRAAGAAEPSEQPGLGGEPASWRSNSLGVRRPALSLEVPAGGKDSIPQRTRQRRRDSSGAQRGEAEQANAEGAKESQRLGAQGAGEPEEGAEGPGRDREEGSATPRRTVSNRNPGPAAKGLLSPRGVPQGLDWRIQSMNSRSPFSRSRPPGAPERSPEAAPGAPAESVLGSETLTPSRLSKMFFARSKSLGLRTTERLPAPGPEKPPRRPASGVPPAAAGPKAPAAADKRKARLEARQPSRNGRLPGGGPAPGTGGEGGLMGRGLSELAVAYEVGEKVGEGRCGVSVRRCVERSSGRAYACKSTPKSMLLEPRKVEALRTEVAILEMLQGSPGIVQLHQVLEEPQEVHMIMELCPGGDLLTHINSCPHISEKQAATFCRLIARGLQRCHEAGVLHRDLKPENVLITGRGSQADIRVADFGISTLLAPGQRVAGYAGSPYYVAPEVLTGSYGVEADVWSLGVILYVLLCQHLPFWDDDDARIYHAILQGRYDTKSGAWLDISAQGIDLVRRMLCLDPRRRITLPRVLEHPWIVGNQLPELSGLLPATPELPTLKLSRRRRAIARTEGTIMGTLKLTFCMAPVQRASSSEAEERPEKLAFRTRDGAADGSASYTGVS